jgi:alginate O-acetyltransferase complex protein AlgI
VAVTDVVEGLRLIAWGLVKKAVFADRLALIVDRVYAQPAAFDGWACLVATYGFALQIYFDFSAYSEIAKGTARMFGVELVWNFDQPYLATDIRDFWRRWHISLSNWFRDYVFIPLGGSAGSRASTLRNLVVTMLLSGLWHGAAWTFVAWGLLHGGFLLFHALYRDSTLARLVRRLLGALYTPLSALGTFHVVCLGWVLFRAEHFADAGAVMRALGTLADAPPTGGQLLFMGATLGFLGASLLGRRWQVMDRIAGHDLLRAFFLLACFVTTWLGAADESPPFIYFQF